MIPFLIMTVETEKEPRSFPLEVGEKLTLSILDLNSRAEGTAKHKGAVVFIPGVLPGETVEVEIEKVARSFARGKALRVVQTTPHRERARCPIHLQPDDAGLFLDRLHCGGCQLQIFDREKEIEGKRALVEENLSRVGSLSVEVLRVEHGNPWRYRNKMSFTVLEEEGRIEWGLRASEEGEYSVPLPSCDIARPELWEAAVTVRERLREEFGSGFVWDGEKGYLRGATVRYHTGRPGLNRQELDRAVLDPVSVVLLAVTSQDPALALRVVSALEEIPDLHVFVGYSDPRASNIYYDRTRFFNRLPNRPPSWGEAVITEEVSAWHTTGPWSTLVGPMNFLQVNDEMAERLYQTVLNLDYAGGGFAIDAFCGVGVLTRALANRFEQVMGIELDTQSIKLARATARRLGDCRVEWVSEPAETVFRAWNRGGYGKGRPKPDLVVLDPPRKGCQNDVLKTLNEVKPKDVVYISCHPAALARDLKVLCKKNFEVVRVQPFDLFPQTHHVETLVHLKAR